MSGKNSEYISVSELSNMVGKSKQWIYKLVKNKPSFSGYVKEIDGKTMIHKSAVWREFGIGVDGEADLNTVESTKVESKTTEEILIDTLREQLAAKDKQIADLSEALLNSQKLQGVLSARIAMLEDKQAVKENDLQGAADIPEEKDAGAEQPQPQPQADQKETEPVTFWQRFVKWLK